MSARACRDHDPGGRPRETMGTERGLHFESGDNTY